jgi:hypothetical protein
MEVVALDNLRGRACGTRPWVQGGISHRVNDVYESWMEPKRCLTASRSSKMEEIERRYEIIRARDFRSDLLEKLGGRKASPSH